MSTTTAPPPRAKPGPRTGSGRQRTRKIGRYVSCDTGREREVVRIELPDGSALVVDHQIGTPSDGRLVAQIATSEPVENAQIVCDLYLADPTRGHCRRVTPADFDTTRHTTPAPSSGHEPRPAGLPGLDPDAIDIPALGEQPTATDTAHGATVRGWPIHREREQSAA